MSKYAEEAAHEKYLKKDKERKYDKGSNSKIQKILNRLDHIETLLIKLTRCRPDTPIPGCGLTRSQILFLGESDIEEEQDLN